MARNAWTAEQVKLAFHLYCQLPFGRLSRGNPEVIALANLIGRTPSAVALKLTNLASLDPVIIASGRTGMSNVSKLDRAIWQEFHTDWDGLVIECSQIRADMEKASGLPIEPGSISDDLTPDFTGETRSQIVQQRIGQAFFRRAVLSSYRSRCCITGLSQPQLLIASHIAPWGQDKANRLNPSNGLCLSALHDRAFDQGLITLDDDWRVVLSAQLKQPDPALQRYFHSVEGRTIELPERFSPDPALMQHHREQVFLDATLA